MKKLKLKERKISELIASQYNPRTITPEQLVALRNSIKEFGLIEPIIINVNKKRKNIIISGHQRLKACVTLDMKIVPCIEVDLNLKKEKQLNLRMNKNGGRFDVEMLSKHFEKEMLIDVGFQEFEFGNTDDIDDIFDNIEDYKLTTPKNKIVLEYTDEEHQNVTDKLAELDGTKEEIIYRLLIG
tara:strand:- start:918 stop:1469 length:552 start_codon:yes stop_codon:yes gene_type:complete